MIALRLSTGFQSSRWRVGAERGSVSRMSTPSARVDRGKKHGPAESWTKRRQCQRRIHTIERSRRTRFRQTAPSRSMLGW